MAGCVFRVQPSLNKVASLDDRKNVRGSLNCSLTKSLLQMMAALFAVESAKKCVRGTKSSRSSGTGKASELLSEAVEKTADVLEGKKEEPHKHG